VNRDELFSAQYKKYLADSLRNRVWLRRLSGGAGAEAAAENRGTGAKISAQTPKVVARNNNGPAAAARGKKPKTRSSAVEARTA